MKRANDIAAPARFIVGYSRTTLNLTYFTSSLAPFELRFSRNDNDSLLSGACLFALFSFCCSRSGALTRANSMHLVVSCVFFLFRFPHFFQSPPFTAITRTDGYRGGGQKRQCFVSFFTTVSIFAFGLFFLMFSCSLRLALQADRGWSS